MKKEGSPGLAPLEARLEEPPVVRVEDRREIVD